MTKWRVLIQFQETKIAYLVHTPTEVQQRGYHNDRIYKGDPWEMSPNELQLFTDAETADEAKAKARQLLLKYVEES